MDATSLLASAAKAVEGARQSAYGSPLDNHTCTAEMWMAYLIRRGWKTPDATYATNVLELPLTPRDVCNLNILQKISRDANAPKDDNDVDIVGYTMNKHMLDEDDSPVNRDDYSAAI